MALIVEAVGQSGVVERITVEGGKAFINAQPGLSYRILDESGRQLNTSATVRRVADHLIIEGLPGETTIQLTDFFFVCTPNDPCSLDLEGIGGANGETITQMSEPIAAMADGSFVLHAPASMATPTAPEAEFSAKPALAGLALLAVAGGGGGGGGGGGDGPPPPPPGSTTVTSPPATNDPTPVITGTSAAGARITVTLEIPGAGSVTFNTVTDGNGNWSVDTGTATPTSGTMPAAGLPLDAPTTVRILTVGTTETFSYQLVMDVDPPAAPVIDPVTGDDIISADEARDADPSPIVVEGSAEAGATVVVSWHGEDQVTTADENGLWSVTFDGQEIPDGDDVISAVAIDLAGNSSSPGTRAVSVVTDRPSRPIVDDVTGNNIINIAESNAGFTITGTATAGNQVFVSFAGLFTDREADVSGETWSITVDDPTELAQLEDGGTYTVTAYASDGINRSAVGTSGEIRVDRTAPNDPEIDPVATINAEMATGPVTITGTVPGTEAGRMVEVTWGGETLPRVNVAENGSWTAVFAPDQIPDDGPDTVISVIAFDAAGNASGATPQLVIVDTTAPALQINLVAGDNIINASEAGATVTITGTTEPGSSVEVTWGSTTLTATVTGNTWSVDFDPGQFPLTPNSTVSATATDAAGNQGTDTQEVTTNTTPATVEIDPVTGDNIIDATEAGAIVTITGTTEPGSSVEVTWGSTTLTATVTGNTWSVDFDPGQFPLTPNSTVSAAVTNAAGNQGADTQEVTTSVTPPAVEIDPVTGDNIIDATEAGATVTITGTTEPGSSVEVTWGGAPREATVTGNTWTVDFAPGQFPLTNSTVSATATNAFGIQGTDTQAVTIDPTPPTVEINDVAGDNVLDATEAGATVTITGTTEPGSSVEVTWGGAPREATVTGDTWTVDFAPGQFPLTNSTVSATATNIFGIQDTDTQAVTINPTPPTIEINDVTGDNIIDASESTGPVPITGTTEPGSTVQVTWGDTTLAAAVTDSTWTVNFAPGQFPLTNSTVSATATNILDIQGSASQDVTFDLSGALDGGGSFALMSLDLAVPEFELDGVRSVSIDQLVDDSNGAPGTVVANGGFAGDSTPVLTISLPDLLGDGESIRLLRDGVTVASTDDPGTSWDLDDGLGLSTEGPHSYTAELVSGGSVLATSDTHLYNFQMI